MALDLEEREGGSVSQEMMRTEDVPHCPLCGNDSRRVLYTGLKDRLFGALGEWNLKECCRCGLVFLDPRPIPAHLKKAYANYHTHLVSDSFNVHKSRKASLLRCIYREAKNSYLHRRWGYGNGLQRRRAFLAFLIYLWPTLRADLDFSVMHLEAAPGERLLDIGCGSGELLGRLNARGWRGEGLDFDESAVRVARNRGLNVYYGTLESRAYSDESFDVIVMSHVIEHMPEPLPLLQECYRIMRPNGHLILVTPNKESWTHKIFKRDWRGLEPPRHLCVFAPHTLRTCVRKAGFEKYRLETTVRDAHVFLLGTLDVRRGKVHRSWAEQPRKLKILARSYRAILGLGALLDQSVGDEIILIAKKSHGKKV